MPYHQLDRLNFLKSFLSSFGHIKHAVKLYINYFRISAFQPMKTKTLTFDYHPLQLSGNKHPLFTSTYMYTA